MTTFAFAGVIQGAISETATRLGLKFGDKIPLDKEKVATNTFYTVFAEVSRRNNVDSNNLAFNLSR